MLASRDESRQKQAPEAHPTHVSPQQNPQRHAGQTHNELKQLQPDNLINQGRAAAANEQHQQPRQGSAGIRQRRGSHIIFHTLFRRNGQFLQIREGLIELILAISFHRLGQSPPGYTSDSNCFSLKP